jgi:flagellar biosynthesis/type III secretory pathway protein FliH
MSDLIKAHDAATISARVRPLPEEPLSRVPEPQPDLGPPPELISLRHKVEALALEVERRNAQIARLEDDVQRAWREGESEGRKSERHDIDERRADELAALRQGIERALVQFGDQFSRLDRFAVLAAREGLANVLGDPSRYIELAAPVIRRQLEQIELESLVCVLVSSDDFANPLELAELSKAIGRRGVEIKIGDDLAAGECRIDLVLGALEAGVVQQWARLRSTLGELETAS